MRPPMSFGSSSACVRVLLLTSFRVHQQTRKLKRTLESLLCFTLGPCPMPISKKSEGPYGRPLAEQASEGASAESGGATSKTLASDHGDKVPALPPFHHTGEQVLATMVSKTRAAFKRASGSLRTMAWHVIEIR